MITHSTLALRTHDHVLGPAAMRTFFRIAEAWGLTQTEQRRLLGDPPILAGIRLSESLTCSASSMR